VQALAADWTSSRACTGLRNGHLKLWDLTSGAKLQDLSGGADSAKAGETSVSAVAIDIQGHRAASGFEDGHLAYWHFEGGSGAKKANASPAAAKDGSGAKKTDTTGAKVLLAHYSAIRTIDAMWGDSVSKALCGSDDGSLSLWNLTSQQCLARFARHIGYVWAIYADWVKERAVSGAFDGCLKLWDLTNGECLRTVQGHSRPVRSIAAGG